MTIRKKRILLVRDGDFSIHIHQLVEFLATSGHEVEVFNTCNREPEPLYRDLVEKVKRLNVKCCLIQDRACWIERKLVALAFKLRIFTKLGAMTPYKIRHARYALANTKAHDLVIACDPYSLFLVSKFLPISLSRIVDYSLEVSDESHGDFQTNRTERSFRYFERSILPKIKALMIQDRFRAQVLLRKVPNADAVKKIFFPVVMNGPAFHRDHGTLRERRAREGKVLFFGGLWSQALLRELEVVSSRLEQGQELVIQGGRGTVRPSQIAGKKLTISTMPISFDDVNEFIASADIGLAVYPNVEANSRCSAFASEKVARYLQCGIPFIAFHNEDYAYLRSETGCCELIRAYSEIPDAVNLIFDSYGNYQRGARIAFDRFYCREATGEGLLCEINKLS